ncbi:MAG: rhodanese-like domain-containing protein [Acidobacteriota bacterium]
MNLKSRSSLALLMLFVFSSLTQATRPATISQDEAELDKVERVSVDELILMVAKRKPVTIIDVRQHDTYEEKIAGALEIPFDQVEAHLKQIPRAREIITYCA